MTFGCFNAKFGYFGMKSHDIFATILQQGLIGPELMQETGKIKDRIEIGELLSRYYRDFRRGQNELPLT